MSRVIWKETLTESVRPGPGNYGLCDLSLPAGAEILHVDRQGRSYCVWFSVPTAEVTSTARFTFAFVPTGGDIPEKATSLAPRHLGTIVDETTALVWHIFLTAISPE